MASNIPLGPIEAINRSHDLSAFDCGQSALNEYLRKYALSNQQNRSARNYVVARGKLVAGFYTLAAGSVQADSAPLRIKKGLGRYPIPIILLARLAVDNQEKAGDSGGRC